MTIPAVLAVRLVMTLLVCDEVMQSEAVVVLAR